MRAIPPHIRGSEIERARRKQRRNAPQLSERARWRREARRRIACASLQNDFFLSGLQRSSWTFSSMSLSMAIPNRDRVKTRVLGNLRYWQNDRDD